jgi:ribosomal protein S27AE
MRCPRCGADMVLIPISVKAGNYVCPRCGYKEYVHD